MAGMLLAFGCQSIAGVEDVSYAGGASRCASFCQTVMEACPGDVAVYEDQAACEKICTLFDAGNPDKPQGNTLACRASQAEVALRLSSDPSENRTNCAAAGPGGDTTCTIYEKLPDCEGYCKIYMTACKTTKDWGFTNAQQCIDRCAAFPHQDTFTVAGGQEGDSLACRLHHATLAVSDPDTHCKSAGMLPQGACTGTGDPDCDDYCLVNRTACTGEYAAYENNRQCLAVCKATRKGSHNVDQQDTVGCRTYHSYFALQGQPTPHCSHSGPAGDGVCSDNGEKHPNCAAFCRFFALGCPSQFEDAYGGNDGACVDECETLEDASRSQYSVRAAQSGNTLKCRILHAVRALTEPLSPDAPQRCEAALGGEPCN